MFAAITGASGHLGTNLVSALLRRGARVRVLVHRNPGSLADLPVEIVHGDVRDEGTARALVEGVEVLFHGAAKISIDGDRDGSVWSTNVEGVACMARNALRAGVRRMVHFSSVHSYDLHAAGAEIDENSPRAESPGAAVYDRSKLAGERALCAVMEAGLDAVVLSPVGIIGPEDPEPSRMGRVLRALFRGRMAAITAGGFSWVDVRDVVDAALAATEGGGTARNYLLGGHRCSFVELSELASRISGSRPPRFTAPLWLAKATAPFGEVLGRALGREATFTRESVSAISAFPRVSSAAAARDLGFRPRPIEETLSDLHAWFAGRGSTESRAS